ncbi:cellulose synthase subunit BcsC [Polystyrenella longa]|uniref:Cellulose synthase subunit BcsC n=1 Tax=Polystyrenella longa TaxID=2528007 RepID=A0A518CM86_9PLAN|nr:tetratricopeptide repeat protein [Polystyrenella longa]QDU80338.1 cellulose synthase subunit BcsC [Polystyrenella longa]
MLLNKLYGWKSGIAVLCLSVAMTGCASSGGFLAKMKPSSIRKVWNKSRTGLEEPQEVHESYAKWQEQQGNLTEARQSYEFVLKQNPKSVDAMLGLARLDQLGGQAERAEKAIQDAQSIAPNDPSVLSALGQFYVSQGRFSEATDALQQAALISPNDTTVQYHLGVALARSGDLDSARPYFVRTVGEAEAHYNIGYILNEMGQSVAAEQELMASLQKKPDLQSSQQLLGDIRGQHAQTMLAQGQVPQQQFVQQQPVQQYAAMPQGMLVQQAQPGAMPAYQQVQQPVQQPMQQGVMMGSPVQQVQAQMPGQPNHQVVEAYWQNQNSVAPQNQVTHASGTPQQQHVPIIQQQYIGGQPPVQQGQLQQSPQGQQIEQWNPQGTAQR